MKQQEEQWLTQVYADTFPIVARFIRNRGGDLEMARDIFHDALVIYLEKKARGELNIRKSAAQYITGISKIVWLKKRKGEEPFVPLTPEYQPAEQASLLQKEERHINDYLQLAGSRCMDLLIAFYYKMQPLQHIVSEFRFSSHHSASVQKYKCLEKLRNKLKESEVYEEVIS